METNTSTECKKCGELKSDCLAGRGCRVNGNYPNGPENSTEALVVALRLAFTAPTDERAAACTAVAESVARVLTPRQVARCKKIAERNTSIRFAR